MDSNRKRIAGGIVGGDTAARELDRAGRDKRRSTLGEIERKHGAAESGDRTAIADCIAKIVLAVIGPGKSRRQQLRGARGVGRRIDGNDIGLLAGIRAGKIALGARESDIGPVGADLRPNAAASYGRAVGVGERDDFSGLRVVNENIGDAVATDIVDQIVGCALEHHQVSVGAERRCPAIIVLVRGRQRAAVAVALHTTDSRDLLQGVVDGVVDVDLSDRIGSIASVVAGVETVRVTTFRDADDSRRAPETDKLPVAADRRIKDRCRIDVRRVYRRVGRVSRIAGDLDQHCPAVVRHQNVVAKYLVRISFCGDELAVAADHGRAGGIRDQRNLLRQSIVEEDVGLVVPRKLEMALEHDQAPVGTERRQAIE